MAAFRLRVMAGLIASLVSTSAFAPDFAVLLDATVELQERLEVQAARSARAAQTFGATLTAADRRALQSACTALVANPADARAQRTLQEFLSRYKDNAPEAVMRFCLDPSITFLREQVLVSRGSLERGSAAGAEASAELESTLQKQQHLEQMISNIMKAGHNAPRDAVSTAR